MFVNLTDDVSASPATNLTARHWFHVLYSVAKTTKAKWLDADHETNLNVAGLIYFNVQSFNILDVRAWKMLALSTLMIFLKNMEKKTSCPE